ncbi:hypothetical protein [Nocardioides aurantiacus]|uniref:TIR domain-containing protein n=1 Tax=Nocardioides aurantiacus TaxID=86796 RepID=A0A3N2CWN8_9ACTN|nr:hypothetical protein [Nocardioides aurantiacus]ROR91965.1 hypothetical protein EDD33_2846 [Nocardioides aurantiacus]
MSESDARQIFVAAASEQDLVNAQRLLRAAGLRPGGFGSSDNAGVIGEAAVDLLSRSSGALAVVSSRGLTSNVAFEIGMAAGAGLPVVVLQLVDKNDPPYELPTDLRSIFQVRWDPAEAPSQSLAARLHDLFMVKSPRVDTVPHVGSEENRRPFADEAERRVATALAPIAESVVPQGPGNAVGVPDLAAWVEDLPNWANPVLVEVKARDLTGRGHGRAIAGLRTYMIRGQISLGLVVVPGLHEVEWHSTEGTAIALLGIDTLERMPREEVVALLMRGRNLVAHAK